MFSWKGARQRNTRKVRVLKPGGLGHRMKMKTFKAQKNLLLSVLHTRTYGIYQPEYVRNNDKFYYYFFQAPFSILAPGCEVLSGFGVGWGVGRLVCWFAGGAWGKEGLGVREWGLGVNETNMPTPLTVKGQVPSSSQRPRSEPNVL